MGLQQNDTAFGLREAVVLVLVAFIWGFNFVVIRIGLDHFPPLLFSALRFVVSAIPGVFIIPRPRIPLASLLALGIMLGIILFSLLFLGIAAGVAPGLASLVMQTHVLFTILLGAALLGERPHPLQWLAVAIGFAGIALITIETGWTPHLLALALVLGGAVAWGISNIQMKRLPRTDMLGLMVWISLIPPVPLILLAIAIDGWSAVSDALQGLTWSGAAAVAYTGYLSTVFAYGCWGAMLQRHSTSVVAPFALLVPVFGMGAAAIFLGEQFGALRLAASALILLALTLNLFGPRMALRHRNRISPG